MARAVAVTASRIVGRVRALLAWTWRAVRRWSGDAAYEEYLTRSGGARPLDRSAFYLDALERKYRQPNRCC